MKQDLLLQLEEIGYNVIEREVSGKKSYQCEIPQDEGSLRIEAFGIKVDKDGFEFWDGREQISKPVKFSHSEELITYISELFPIISRP